MELFNSNLYTISCLINNSIENDSPLHTTVIQTYLDSTKKTSPACVQSYPSIWKSIAINATIAKRPFANSAANLVFFTCGSWTTVTSCAACPILLLQKIVAIGLGYKSLKLTWHLKIDGWNTSLYIFLLEWHRFKCYVSIGVANWTSAGHFESPPRLGKAQNCWNEIRNHSDMIWWFPKIVVPLNHPF